MKMHARATSPLQYSAKSNSGHGLLLQGQCACGGVCATCRSKKRLQAKLAIRASNDPLEQEADRVADQVLAAPAHPAVKRASPNIQRSTGPATGVASAAPASVEHVLASSGRPLDSALQQDMGQRFGHDFSRVRVHSGAAAEQSARDVSAHAYTVGHNIVFGAGQFAPMAHAGRRLIAHELMHVVQQGAATASGSGSLRPALQRKPGPPKFTKGDVVILKLPLLRMATTLGGAKLAALLARGDRLEVEAIEPQGGGAVYQVKVIDNADPAKNGKVGVVRVDWVMQAPPKPAAASATSAASPPLIEMDLDPSDPALPLKTPGYSDPPRPQPMSVLEAYQKQLMAAAPLTQAVMDEFGASRDPAQRAAVTVLVLRKEIIAAARATGDQGIPPQLLGAIISVEMLNRGADLNKEIAWARNIHLGDPSIGVSQLKLSSAAMVEGDIPWIEAQTPTDQGRAAAKKQVDKAYSGLSDETRKALLEKLAAPTTSVPLTARYLAKLKNRPNRFPDIKAEKMTQFGQGRESGVIATEYNLGPTATAAADASASDYGLSVAHLTYHEAMRAVLGL